MAGVAGVIDGYSRATSLGFASVLAEGTMVIDRTDGDDTETRLKVDLPNGLCGIEFSEVVRELQTVRT